MTWGAIRPVILVPAYVEDWSEREREVVIRHERAHIERRDWLWQGFAQVMTAVFWFHPLVWLACVQIRKEAEHAADDATLATGVQAPDYADRLMAVARQLKGGSPEAAVAMLRKPVLTSRIAAILDTAADANRRKYWRANRSRARSGGVAGPAQRVSKSDCISHGRSWSERSIRDQQGEPKLHAGSEGSQDPGDGRDHCCGEQPGRADDIQVIQSLDPGLDANAVGAVSQWQFTPGTKDGQPVDVAATIEINFKLL